MSRLIPLDGHSAIGMSRGGSGGFIKAYCILGIITSYGNIDGFGWGVGLPSTSPTTQIDSLTPTAAIVF